MTEFKEEVRKALSEAKKTWADNLSKEELRDLVLKIDSLLEEEAPKALMRFTTLNELITMFQRGGLVLHNADRWDDQVDRAYMERGARAIEAKKYGVMCFYGVGGANEDDTFETTAHWGTYSSQNAADDASKCLDYGVAIEFDPRYLNETMIKKTLGDKQGYEVRMDKIEYIEFDAYCKLKNEWFFRKRKEYRWEQEWRLVVASRNEEGMDEIFVPMRPGQLDKMIKKVVYSPHIMRKCLKKEGSRLDVIKKNVGTMLKKMDVEDSYRKILSKILLDKGESNRSNVFDNVNAMKNALPKEGIVPCPYRRIDCNCCEYWNAIDATALFSKLEKCK